MSKKDRRRIRASCAAALAQARWLISLEHGRRLLARLLALRGSVARGATAGVLAASLALSPVQASGPFTSGDAPLGGVRPTFADIDNDGDLDALVGTTDGFVRYFLNFSGETFNFTSAFAEQTGADNPFTGTQFGSTIGGTPNPSANPVFVDIDNDGDQDVFVGSNSNTLAFYRNDGSAEVPDLVEITNPDEHPLSGVASDNGIPAVRPAFADLDGDGDQDFFLGLEDGTIFYLRNNSDPVTGAADFSNQAGATNPLAGIDIGSGGDIELAFGDLNGDNILDVVIADDNGNFTYFQNQGTTTNPDFADQTGVNNPFDGLEGTPGARIASVELADIDGDGDQDAFLSDTSNAIQFYRNTATLPAVNFDREDANPFIGVDVGNNAHLTFGDLDGDGDADAFVGASAGDGTGRVFYYENTGSAFQPDSTEDLNLQTTDRGAVPALVQIDADSDLDVFVGTYYYLIDYDNYIYEYSGRVLYYQNTGGTTNPTFGSPAPANDHPLDTGVVSDSYSFLAPTFADIDDDGDPDAFIGTTTGNVLFFRNVSGTFTPEGGNAPFGIQDPSTADDFSTPAFVDFDNDGDLDLFIGTRRGTVPFYRNTGSRTNPSFSLDNTVNNPFAGDPSIQSPAFLDFDGDGDADAFGGRNNGTIAYFENQAQPPVPVAFTANVSTTTQIDLSWTDNSNVETGFVIERSLDGNNWSVIETTDPNVTSFSDTGLTGNTTYFYRIKTVNGNFESAFTSPISANTGQQPAPTDLAASIDGATPAITLTWTDPSSSEAGFRVERSPAGAGTWATLADLDPDTTTYVDSDVQPGESYDYRVITLGASEDLNSAPITISATLTQLAAPTNLSSSNVTSTTVIINWESPTGNVTGFIVERFTDGQGWQQVGTSLSASATSFTDTGLRPETTYQYRVTAIGGEGAATSEPSDPPLEVTTAAGEVPILATPTNLRSSNVTSTTVTIGWDSSGGDVAGFIVQRSTDGNNWQQVAANLPASTTSFTDENLDPDTEYQYRVIAVGGEGVSNSDPSTPITVRTNPVGQEPDEPTIYLPLIYRP